jgi:hypothetical protein
MGYRPVSPHCHNRRVVFAGHFLTAKLSDGPLSTVTWHCLLDHDSPGVPEHDRRQRRKPDAPGPQFRDRCHPGARPRRGPRKGAGSPQARALSPGRLTSVQPAVGRQNGPRLPAPPGARRRSSPPICQPTCERSARSRYSRSVSPGPRRRSSGNHFFPFRPRPGRHRAAEPGSPRTSPIAQRWFARGDPGGRPAIRTRLLGDLDRCPTPPDPTAQLATGCSASSDDGQGGRGGRDSSAASQGV